MYNFIQNNFATLVAVLFLAIFIKTNILLNRDITKKLSISIILLLILVIADNIELWAAAQAEPTRLRIYMSIIGYIVRPLIIYVLLLCVYSRNRKKILFLGVPAVVNACIILTALFSDVAFSYNADNEFVRGPLGFLTHITSLIYLCAILICSVYYFKEKNFAEATIILVIVVTCVVSTSLEMIFKHVGLVKEAIAISITFFYLYLHTQFFKKDPLTGVRNRQCFYYDAEKNKGALSAVVAVDLNDLKQINDTKGHAEGDKAICSVVACIQRCLIKGCRVYRTGGDEFMILCNNRKFDDIRKMIDDINAEIKKTMYCCAFGAAENNKGKEFEKLCAEADEQMYENKRKMKSAVDK